MTIFYTILTNSNSLLDIDECQENNHTCLETENAACKNTLGSYTCLCFEGFRSDGNNGCVDVDECSEGLIFFSL